MKKIITACIFVFSVCVSLFAQQIPKFGIVDTSRVFQTYFRDSAAVRNFEAKKSEFQNEIVKRTEELKQLQQQKINLKEAGDEAGALKTDAEIIKKADYLTAYTQAKNSELDSLKSKLENSDSFYQSLYDIIGRIAESEGYSMILSLQQASNILWYSPSVDITDKVINNLASIR
jgi:outer membrane protein